MKYESGNMHEYLQYFFNFKGLITYPKKQETKSCFSCFITSKTYFILKKYIYIRIFYQYFDQHSLKNVFYIYIFFLSLESHESLSVVDKVHRSSTWVKVQIRIIKYYSSKSKSTAFSILLEWKYKSTQFFMYLSKKVLIYRFILQFYIDYFISFYISTYLYNHTAQNTWVFPKITTI